MSADDKYRNEGQLRLLRVLLALEGHDVNGLAPGQLAAGLRISAPTITRDLANLRIAGVAEQLPDGRWRMSSRIPQIAVAMARGLADARSRVEEIEQRYSRQR